MHLTDYLFLNGKDRKKRKTNTEQLTLTPNLGEVPFIKDESHGYYNPAKWLTT